MKKPLDQNSLDLEIQYRLYLQRVKLNEATMHPTQRKQVKQAFYGACGQLLILQRDVIGDMPTEKEAIAALEDLKNQIGNFWNKQTSREN